MVAGSCVRSYVLRRGIFQISRAKIFVRTYPCTTAGSSKKLQFVPTFRLASQWPHRIAITDQYGDYSYRSLFLGSKALANNITELLDGKLQERVAFLCPSNATYVLTQWACWMSGQIAVPLSPAHPVDLLEYFIKDSDCRLLVTTNEYGQKMKSLSEKTGVRLMFVEDDLREGALLTHNVVTENRALRGGLNPNQYNRCNALILYTSGTTALPKGVPLTFGNISAQIKSMISAWGWKSEDSVLHTLPLHHTHGIMNALLTPLHCGARCVMLPKFNPKELWNQLLSVNSPRITVLTGVPTMYVKLIEEYDKSWGENREMMNYIKATCSQKIRLMMCGSAALPVSIFDKWERITGHRLLERYGMTEIGMALSNPLNGWRKPGFVGNPLPGVNIRIVNNDKTLVQGNEYSSKIVINDKSMEYTGELHVKGDSVMKEYWRKPEATEKEFTKDGWFKTGDTAQFTENSYKILGRSSVDIIKSGGYKISALFIESILLQHPNVRDVAVIGLPDSTWGQQVVALISVIKEEKNTTISIKKWAGDKLPLYSIPAVWRIVPEIPRNVMGKINKKEIIQKMIEELHAY